MANAAVAHKAKGNEFFKKGDYTTAVVWYTKAVDADPGNRVYYSNRAAAYQKMGNYAKAEEDGRLCIRCDPDWNKGYFRLATALESQGKYEEVMAVCNTGLDKTYDARNNSGDKNLLNMKERCEPYAKQQAEKRVSALPKNQQLKAAGDAAFKRHEYDKADKIYTEAIDACRGKDGLNVKLRCLSNRSEARKQLGNWPGVNEDVANMMEHRDELTNNILKKALYRGALAFQNQEKFRFALKFATELVDLFMRERLIAGTSMDKPTNKLEINAIKLKSELTVNVREARADGRRK